MPGVSRLSPVAGAEITGVDLAHPLAPALKERILGAFRAHHVVVFRDQSLGKDQQYALTLQFGEIEEHVGRHADGRRYDIVHTVSNLDAQGQPSAVSGTSGNYHWHTDKSYHRVPSLMTILHAVELPSAGGETEFANTALAYAALPEKTKRRIASLRAVHSWEASRHKAGGTPPTAEDLRERPPVDHPLVRTHPETGEKALYLGLHAAHVLGLPESQGKALLDELLAHATAPRFVYAHRWRRGDVVMWDNRCLLHRARANYAMDRERRVLHRTVVRGTVPI
jgi:taurine dioxygenase